MTLIRSISGIRGTIGGKPSEGLTPHDIVKYASAYAVWLKQKNAQSNGKPRHLKIVIGRDARVSGEMLNHIVTGTLLGMGIDVLDIGLSTTPTVEMAVSMEKAHGGIILTASHNPKQWNALKLLNEKGEFISAADGEKLLKIAEKNEYEYPHADFIGKYTQADGYIDSHIEKILQLPLVNVQAIKSSKFKVVIDCVNSTGGIALPKLLKALGVSNVIELYCEPTGLFPHNPEPLPEHLSSIANAVVKNNAHLGIVVDPDVDRLALVQEDGEMFGEEYTLVAVADYVLQNTKGNTVSNLSSTRALRDITEKHGCMYAASAVGEVNVVEKMKDIDAVIGGEGNGGIIYPELHYGRDAMVGIALFLSHLAVFGKSCSKLRKQYPAYYISKNKIELNRDVDLVRVLKAIKNKYKKQPLNTVDGIKIEFEKEWVHLRQSNTEPIIRIYSESDSLAKANHLATKMIADIKELMNETVQ
jgi:phosphomannomutase